MLQKIKELKDNAHKALLEAQKIRDQHKDGIPSDAEEGFNKAMEDFEKYNSEAEKLERQHEAFGKIDEAVKQYNDPENDGIQHHGQDSEHGSQGGADSSFESMVPKDIYGTPQHEYRPIPRELHADLVAAERLYIRRGDQSGYQKLNAKLARYGPVEQFALVTTEGPLGGFLTTPELRRTVDVAMGTLAVMRGICRVERTGSNPLVLPTVQGGGDDKFPSGYRGAWKKEGYVTGGTAPPTQDQPKFGQSSVPVHWWAPDAVEISPITLQDAFADVEGILARVIAETKGVSEDYAFIQGDGNGIPEGILNAGLSEVKSGDAAAITYDGLIDLWTNLPPQYLANARWLMKTTTYGAVLKLKDDNGMPLINVNTTPTQLWGKPITFSEFMPDIAGDATPIAFGDFKNYVIAERSDLRIQRLTEKFAPNVGFLPTSRLGGQVVRSRGLRLQKIAA